MLKPEIQLRKKKLDNQMRIMAVKQKRHSFPKCGVEIEKELSGWYIEIAGGDNVIACSNVIEDDVVFVIEAYIDKAREDIKELKENIKELEVMKLRVEG